MKLKGKQLHEWKIWGYERLKDNEKDVDLAELGSRLSRVRTTRARLGRQIRNVLQRIVRDSSFRRLGNFLLLVSFYILLILAIFKWVK